MKYTKIGLAIVVAVLLFGFGMLWGFGCNNSTAPVASVPQAQTPAPTNQQQSLTPEEVIAQFRNALSQGDIDAAMKYVHPAGQEKIRGYLEEMKKIDTLEAFSKIFGEAKPVRVGEEIAEYDVFEEGNSEPLTMTFMKVGDSWKISDF